MFAGICMAMRRDIDGFLRFARKQLISQYKQRKGQKMMTYIMIKYPLSLRTG